VFGNLKRILLTTIKKEKTDVFSIGFVEYGIL